jgi:hypothetical protein
MFLLNGLRGRRQLPRTINPWGISDRFAFLYCVHLRDMIPGGPFVWMFV